MNDLRDSIAAFRSGKLSPSAQSDLGRSLLREGTALEAEAEELANWLAWAYDKLEAKRHEGLEEEWFEALKDYERVCDMQREIADAIREGTPGTVPVDR